jgi:predicted transcriptional regulator
MTTTSIAVRVPPSIADALEALARQSRQQTGDNTTRADIVRQAIDEHLKRQAKTPDTP